MAQVLRLSSTDQRISYSTGWTIIANTYSFTFSGGSSISLLFRGTSVKVYGRISGGGGQLYFQLDGGSTFLPLNSTNLDDGTTLVWNSGNFGDGDHQLFWLVNTLVPNATVVLDYLELENSSGLGFDPQWEGPNATNVPKEAAIVDSSSPDIVLSNPSQWVSNNILDRYRHSEWATSQPGASLNFSFIGVAIWYYSDVDADHGLYTVSIDGSNPEQLNGYNGGHRTQQMLWSKTDLTPGKHTFTLTQYDVGGKVTTLDFFRVLGGGDASSTPTTTPGPKSNVVPLAVGIPLGLLALVIVVLGAFYLHHRRKPVAPPSEEPLKP